MDEETRLLLCSINAYPHEPLQRLRASAFSHGMMARFKGQEKNPPYRTWGTNKDWELGFEFAGELLALAEEGPS